MIEIYDRTYYYPDTDTVLMHVEPVDFLPKTIEYEDEEFAKRTFRLKPELHITLCSLRGITGESKNARGQRKLLESFGRELRGSIVTVGDMVPPLSLCVKDDGAVASIISPIEVLGLKDSILNLRQNGPSIPVPYTHVTLYTSGDSRGVGVYSATQYGERCRQVTIPALSTLLYEHITQQPV